MPKITALPNTTIPATDDLLPFVDVSGTPTTRKATVANLAASTAFSDEYAPLADPTFTGTVIVPAATAATHAAQVTAIDAATGRLAIGGIEMGDTGLRALTSWDTSGVVTGTPLGTGWGPRANVAGGIFVRRTGNLVSVLVFQMIATEANPAGPFCTLPAGFRYMKSPYFGQALSVSAGLVSVTTLTNHGPLGLGPIASGAIVGTVTATYPTDNAWPTTLPGTAA